MRFTHLLTALVALLAIPAITTAQNAAVPSAPPSTEPPGSVVFVPYDGAASPVISGQRPVLLPYAEFLRLRDGQDLTTGAAELEQTVAAIAEARMAGVIQGDVARIEAAFTVEVLAGEKQRVTVPLVFRDVSLESLSVEGPDAVLAPLEEESETPDPRAARPQPGPPPGIRLMARGSGRRVVRVILVAPLRVLKDSRTLDFGIPVSPAASLALQAPWAVTLDRKPDGPPATVEPGPEGSTIRAACGGRSQVSLSFRPRAATAAVGVPGRLLVEQVLDFQVDSRGLSGEVLTRIEPLGETPQHVVLALAPGVEVLEAGGARVDRWDVLDLPSSDAGAGRRVCTVQLDASGSGSTGEPFEIRLRVSRGDVPLDGGAFDVSGFAVQGAARQLGVVSLAGGEDLSVWPEETRGLLEGSAPAMALTPPQRPGARSFRFGASGWRLAVSVRPVPIRVQAEGLLVYELRESAVHLTVSQRLDFTGRPGFAATFKVPEGYELLTAGPDETISASRQQGRLVALTFRSQQRGACEVRLELRREREASEPDFVMSPATVVDADVHSGFVVLALPRAFRATESSVTNLEATDVRELGDRVRPLLSEEAGPALAYRYFEADFEARAAVERLRTLVTCETARLASISPSLLQIDARLRYEVEFSAIDTFQVLVPAAAGEDVRFSGPEIKEKSRAAIEPETAGAEALTTWTLRVQGRLMGQVPIRVVFDLPLEGAESGDASTITVPVVRAAGVARETGYLAVARGENLEVRVAGSQGLEPRDVKELPEEMREAFLAFRYFDPARQSLSLELVRHEAEPVLGALVAGLRVDTIINDQRQAVHDMYFHVRSNRRPYLELKIPDSQKLWGAWVHGQAVAPTIRQSDGVRLIDLENARSTGESTPVRIVLREELPGGEMGWLGGMRLALAEPANMPVLRMTWRLYLPEDYRYVKFGGDMHREGGGKPPWIVPVAETLLSDLPAAAVGGVAHPSQRPGHVAPPPLPEAAAPEPNGGAQGLDIPIVRQGAVFEFSRLSGVGVITVRYAGPRTLVVLRILVAVLVVVLLAVLCWRTRPVAASLAASVVFLLLAGMSEGLVGRLAAPALVASVLVLLVALVTEARRRSARTVGAGAETVIPEKPAPGSADAETGDQEQ